MPQRYLRRRQKSSFPDTVNLKRAVCEKTAAENAAASSEKRTSGAFAAGRDVEAGRF
jgi:hypothetical protein